MIETPADTLEPPTLEDVILDGAPLAPDGAPAPESEDIKFDPAQFAALVPLMLPEEDSIPAMVAPLAAIGLSESDKAQFIERFSKNTLLVSGLKTIQFRKALEQIIVQYLKTPTTAEGAPALSPAQSLIAGFGAIALAVILERSGGLNAILSMIGFGSNEQTPTQNPAVGDSSSLFNASGVSADGQAIFSD
jgi:hypothetical protein